MNPILEAFVAGLAVGDARAHLALTIHPLLGADGGAPAYLTLDEALATAKFRITEISEGGMVPTLKAVNELDRPVLLLDGEELVGAKQNRVLNLTILVPAGATIEIPVSCVESGRWRHVSDEFIAADRTQFASGRARKLEQVSASLRRAGSRHSDQGDVWDEIAMKSMRMQVSSPSGAMSEIYESRRAPLDDFVAALPPVAGQVGAAFSIAGRLAGVDAFDSAATCARAWPKLLRSYAVDALEVEAPAAEAALDAGAVRDFLGRVAGASVASFRAVGRGEDLRLSGPDLAGAALADSDPEGGGRIVHLVAFPADRYADQAPRGDRFAMHHRRSRME